MIFKLLRRPASRSGLIAALLLASAPARAYVITTPEALLEQFFPGVPVATVVYTPDPAGGVALGTSLGYPLPKPTYEILVGGEAAHPVGYAIFDQQIGLHAPIDFAVLVGPDVRVQRVEILVYREAYGDGVRAPAFLRQFVGLGPSAAMRPGRDIQIVSGATVSTRSLSIGVRRACALVSAWLNTEGS